MKTSISNIKKFVSSELRDDAKGVFLDKYPAEDDVKGWLKIHSTDFLFGNIARKALEYIEKLEKQLGISNDSGVAEEKGGCGSECSECKCGSEPEPIICECGSEQVSLRAVEDGPEYYWCKECGRTWYAA